MSNEIDQYEVYEDDQAEDRFRKELDKEKLQKRRKKNPGMKTK